MATLLNGNDTNRLVEVLAGSTALLNDTHGASALPLSLSSLLSDDASSSDVPASTSTHATGDGPLVTAGLLDPVTGVVDGALGTDTSNLLGIGDVLNLGTPSQLALAGDDGGAQPVFDATNILVKDFHAQIEGFSHTSGTSDILHAVTNLGETIGLGNTGVVPPALDDGHTNLITDVVNAPSTLLNGGLDHVIGQIGGDLGDTLHSTIGVVGAVLNGNDPLNPVPELVNGLTSSLQTLPLLDLNGGNGADGGVLGGGLLGGSLGNITGSSSGHLIDVDLGPAMSNGLGLDLLATPDQTHTASVNAVDVGPNGPQLLDLGVLTGSGIIDVPGLDGAGSDGLVGGLLGGHGLANGLGHGLGGGLLNGDIASGNATSTPLNAPLDIAVLTDNVTSLAGDHGILDLQGAHIL
jgi:hypothetical protein